MSDECLAEDGGYRLGSFVSKKVAFNSVDLTQGFQESALLNCSFTGNHFVKYESERKDIAGRRSRQPANLFRRHVTGCAGHAPRFGAVDCRLLAVRCSLPASQAEIHDFDKAGPRDHDVA